MQCLAFSNLPYTFHYGTAKQKGTQVCTIGFILEIHIDDISPFVHKPAEM